MKEIQEAFLKELMINDESSLIVYAKLYGKYSQLSIEKELSNGASSTRAETMGHYYTFATLSDFIKDNTKVDRIIAIHESDLI